MNSNQNESQLIYWGSLQLLNKKVFNIFNLFASHLGKLERMLRFLFLVQYSLHWYWWCSYPQRIGETWSETLRRNHMNSRSSTDSSGLVEFQFVVKDVKFLCCYLRNKSRYILYSLLVNWRLSYVCATHSMFHKILENIFYFFTPTITITITLALIAACLNVISHTVSWQTFSWSCPSTPLPPLPTDGA